MNRRMSKPHKQLDAWTTAVELAQLVYKTTDEFPAREQFGLTNQARRAAISIPSNIAEGAARQTKKEFIQFLYQARGSLFETVACLKLAQELGYLTQQQVTPLLQQTHEINRMLSGLINYLKKQTGSK